MSVPTIPTFAKDVVLITGIVQRTGRRNRAPAMSGDWRRPEARSYVSEGRLDHPLPEPIATAMSHGWSASAPMGNGQPFYSVDIGLERG